MAVVVGLLVSQPKVNAEIRKFHISYASLQNMAFGGEGYFDELMEITRLDEDRSNFIADFWRTRALAEQNQAIDIILERIFQRSDGTSKEERQKEAIRKSNTLLQSYYYDHWDDINQMIKVSLKLAKEKAE
jgi:hypothetical protein